MSRLEDIRERHLPRIAASSSDMPAPEAGQRSVAWTAPLSKVKASGGWDRFGVFSRMQSVHI